MLYQLQKNLVLELGGCLLTVAHYVVHQFEHIVQNGLFTDFQQQLEHLDCLALLFCCQFSQCLRQGSWLKDQNFAVIFFHAEDAGSFPECFSEEVVNGEVDDFVHDLGRSGLEFEGGVLTVRRADLTLIGCRFVLFTKDVSEDGESLLVFGAVFKHLNFEVASEDDIGSL